MKSRKKAAAAAIAGNVIFGLSFMFSRVVLLDCGHICHAGAAVFHRVSGHECAGMRPGGEGGLEKDLRPLLALGLFQPVLYFTFESLGIKLTNSVIVRALWIATVPVAGMLLGAVFLKERFTVRQLLLRVDVPGGGGADRPCPGKGAAPAWQAFWCWSAR